MQHPFPEEDLFVQLARPNSLLPPHQLPSPICMIFISSPLQSPSSFPFCYASLLSLLLPSALGRVSFIL